MLLLLRWDNTYISGFWWFSALTRPVTVAIATGSAKATGPSMTARATIPPVRISRSQVAPVRGGRTLGDCKGLPSLGWLAALGAPISGGRLFIGQAVELAGLGSVDQGPENVAWHDQGATARVAAVADADGPIEARNGDAFDEIASRCGEPLGPPAFRLVLQPPSRRLVRLVQVESAS